MCVCVYRYIHNYHVAHFKYLTILSFISQNSWEKKRRREEQLEIRQMQTQKADVAKLITDKIKWEGKSINRYQESYFIF